MYNQHYFLSAAKTVSIAIILQVPVPHLAACKVEENQRPQHNAFEWMENNP